MSLYTLSCTIPYLVDIPKSVHVSSAFLFLHFWCTRAELRLTIAHRTTIRLTSPCMRNTSVCMYPPEIRGKTHLVWYLAYAAQKLRASRGLLSTSEQSKGLTSTATVLVVIKLHQHHIHKGKKKKNFRVRSCTSA